MQDTRIRHRRKILAMLLVAACSADEPADGTEPSKDARAAAGYRSGRFWGSDSIADVSVTDLALDDRAVVDAQSRDVPADARAEIGPDVPPSVPDAARDVPSGVPDTGVDGPPPARDADRDGPSVSPDASLDGAPRASTQVAMPAPTSSFPTTPSSSHQCRAVPCSGQSPATGSSFGVPHAEARALRSADVLSYDRNTAEWWDVLVDEHLLSRVNVVMAHGRGCFDPNTGLDGNGNVCPRHLSKLVAAIDRAGAGDVYRLGMWDDTGAYPGARNHVDNLPDGTLLNLADRNSWRFFWDYNMRIWFDTIPSRLWYRLDGRPVIAFWSLAGAFFSHQQGNA